MGKSSGRRRQPSIFFDLTDTESHIPILVEVVKNWLLPQICSLSLPKSCRWIWSLWWNLGILIKIQRREDRKAWDEDQKFSFSKPSLNPWLPLLFSIQTGVYRKWGHIASEQDGDKLQSPSPTSMAATTQLQPACRSSVVKYSDILQIVEIHISTWNPSIWRRWSWL